MGKLSEASAKKRKKAAAAKAAAADAAAAAVSADAAAAAAAADAAAAAAASATDAASPAAAAAMIDAPAVNPPDVTTRVTRGGVSGSAAKRKSGRKRQIEDPVIRRSPRSPQKLAISTAVPSPAANVSVEAVAAVQPTASAKASASVQGVASVPAASLVSISFFVLFVLSDLIYTNSYLLRSVCIPFRIFQLV